MSSVDIASTDAPPGLGPHALFAWRAAMESIGPYRQLTPADLLEIEAMCRSWARWRLLEEKIEDTGRGNILAGEVAKGASGRLEVSGLRKAADLALEGFVSTARAYGITMPGADVDVPNVDLFGQPDRPGKGRPGRPRYVATLRDRNKVQLLVALGWSNSRIAAAIGISEPTLRREFRLFLKDRAAMRDRLDARRLEIAMDEANAGNMTALRLLNAMIAENDLRLYGDRFVKGKAKDEDGNNASKPAPLGKKAQAELDARDVGGASSDWSNDLFPGGRPLN